MLSVIVTAGRIVTAPGIITHEFAHELMCKLTDTKVKKVCYFQRGNPPGFVQHEPAASITKALLISTGPLIINSIACAIVPVVLIALGLQDKNHDTAWGFFGLWLSLSLVIHAFPSNQDMNNFLAHVAFHKGNGPVFAIALAFALLFKLANFLAGYWFDLCYAMLIIYLSLRYLAPLF